MNRRKLLIGAGALAAAGTVGVTTSLRSMGSMAEYETTAAESRRALAANADFAEFVRYATLAPNGHNTQPWRFHIIADRIEILPDLKRRTPAVDPDDHHLFISLGCAAENLALASAASGRSAEIHFNSEGGGRLICDLVASRPQTSILLEAIPGRQSTRAEYDGRALSAAEVAMLDQTADVTGTRMIQVTERSAIAKVRDLVIAGNSRQMADPAFVQELKNWIRFNPAQAIASQDGLFAGASGNPNLPSWLAGTVFDLFFRSDAENDKYRRHIDSSAGIAVFFAERDDAEHWTRIGRSFQRFALQATALGIKTAHLNQPVEVSDLRPELASIVGAGGALPFLVVRFGRGPTLPYSLRRPVANVLV